MQIIITQIAGCSFIYKKETINPATQRGFLFPDSSVVEQLAVNQWVPGSNPGLGAIQNEQVRKSLFFLLLSHFLAVRKFH